LILEVFSNITIEMVSIILKRLHGDSQGLKIAFQKMGPDFLLGYSQYCSLEVVQGFVGRAFEPAPHLIEVVLK
jgi:hypothetical protein